LALIAQDNINVGMVSADTLRIDAALMAQNGRAGRYYYEPNGNFPSGGGSTNCSPYHLRNSLTLYGMIGTAQRYGFAYTDGTGYTTRNNPVTLAEAKNIAKGVRAQSKNYESQVVVCPPFIYLNELKGIVVKDKIALGAQDVYIEPKGAFTGEVSSEMVKAIGVTYVIIGHSERRAMGESNELISKKINAALKVGLSIILCVGEKDRDDHGEYLTHLKEQLSVSLKGVQKKFAGNISIAYEPVWAIGKGHEAMTAHDVHQMSIFIRKHLIHIYNSVAASEIRIIYGGSVDPTNAYAIVHEGEVDGLLVGRDSLSGKDFSAIVKEVDR
jgi:triosephosphate isomerase (TIM)